MKPAPFAYERVKTLDEALEVLTKFGENARILAGGQSLIATLNMRLSKPDILIDINHIDGLAGIEDTGKNIRVGALTRHVEIETSELITKHVPLISKAVDHIAHPAIRNRGTFGGSIAFADPAAELPACILALDATLQLSSKSGVREIKAENFFHSNFKELIKTQEERVLKNNFIMSLPRLFLEIITISTILLICIDIAMNMIKNMENLMIFM